MAVQLPSGFLITAREAIDNRLVLTKAEMVATKAARMPDVYFAACKDDGKFYIYNKDNEADPETGRFRVLEGMAPTGGAMIHQGYYLNDKFYTDSTYSIEIEANKDDIYVDLNMAKDKERVCIYIYDGERYLPNTESLATSVTAGIMKLYDEAGENTDGAITQRAATELSKNGVVDEDDEILFLTNIDLDNMYVEKHGIR